MDNACLWLKKLNFHFLISLFSGIARQDCREPQQMDLAQVPKPFVEAVRRFAAPVPLFAATLLVYILAHLLCLSLCKKRGKKGKNKRKRKSLSHWAHNTWRQNAAVHTGCRAPCNTSAQKLWNTLQSIWECSHSLQATSKSLNANLQANVLMPVWMGPKFATFDLCQNAAFHVLCVKLCESGFATPLDPIPIQMKLKKIGTFDCCCTE